VLIPGQSSPEIYCPNSADQLPTLSLCSRRRFSSDPLTESTVKAEIETAIYERQQILAFIGQDPRLAVTLIATAYAISAFIRILAQSFHYNAKQPSLFFKIVVHDSPPGQKSLRFCFLR
jgi:hypothetical protein